MNLLFVKKLPLTLCFLGLVQLSLAQTSAKEDKLLSKMNDMVCEKMEHANVDELLKSDNPSMALGMMLMPAFEKYQKEIKDVFHMDVTSSADARAVGEKLGIYMAGHCPKFLEITAKLLKSDKELSDKVNTDLEAKGFGIKSAAVETVTGSIDHIETGDLTFVYVLTEGGDTIRLLLFQSFDGAAALITKAGDKKMYTFSYSSLKAFNGRSGKDQDYKQILSYSAN